MSDAKTALELLNDELLKFVETETGFDKAAIEKMDDDEFADLYDAIADIEIDESPEDSDEPSERYEKASEFVTIIGNALYRPEE